MSNEPKWLLFGSSGMLGSDLARELDSHSIHYKAPRREDFDLHLSVENLAPLIEDCAAVINCIAYTKVDLAETEPELAFEINHLWPQKLAEACRITGSHLVHISTDYVFSGDKTSPYLVSDSTNPLSVYGKSKDAGEKAVISSGAEYSIFRTAWLYGINGSCFPKTIISRLKQGQHLSIVSDQFGSPTWTRDLSQLLIRHVQLGHLPEIVHATSSGTCSWYEFALEIANSLGYDQSLIKPISSSEYPTAAMRPKQSSLKCEEGPAGVIGPWKERWHEASKLFR